MGRLRKTLLSSALLFVSVSSWGQATITNGLVAYWSFDQSNFKDSVGIFDGTENGGSPIAFTTGKTGFGKSMILDGVDQMVEITGGAEDDLSFQGASMTVAGWFKVGTFDKSWQALIAKGEGSNWRIHRRGAESGFAHAGGTGEGPAGGPVDDGQWHHFAAMSDVDATDWGTALYIDGQQYSVNTSAPNLAANGKRVMIGENPDARNRYWNGEVDDIALWNRILTEAEISALYNGGVGKALSTFFAAATDTDKDGMPDDWEKQYGLNPNSAADAAQDLNGNGLTNLQEFQRGLDPTVTTKPVIVSSRTTDSFDTVVLTFNKRLDESTATNAANYTISPSLAVTKAAVRGNVVTLTTAKMTPGATPYTVAVSSNVKDVNNFAVAADTKTTVYSYIMTKEGVFKFSSWHNLDSTGTAIDILTGDPDYPNNPDLVGATYSFNSRDIFPDDSHEQYGAQMEGFITPTETGSYRFFIYSDDASALYLSTDDKEANLVQIAEETGCCNFFTEPDSPRTSEPIALTAGKKYYIRLIYKEGGGGDYGQVAWRKEGDKTPAGSLQPISGRFLSSPTDLPFPAEGVFQRRSPGTDAKNVSPATGINIVHLDGKTPWTQNNVTLKVDGAAVTPTFTKAGTMATISYKPAALLPSGSVHTVELTTPDPAGNPSTMTWSFTATTYAGPVLDSVASRPGLLVGKAVQSADKGGHTGAAGDKGIDLGRTGGAHVFIPDGSFVNAESATDELSVSIWVKRYDINDSSAFWLAAPSSSSGERGFQAHTPWSNNNIYFDTAGCCDAGTQRINADIATFPDFTGDNTDLSWWTNKWHNFIFTKKGATKNIFVDGKLFLTGENTNPLPTDFERIYVGADNSGTGGNMHAQVDDFAVFGTALTAAQAQQIFSGTSPSALGASAQLIGFWDFNTAGSTNQPGSSASISRSGNTITISSSAGGTVQGTDVLSPANWKDIGPAPQNVQATGRARYFRIKN